MDIGGEGREAGSFGEGAGIGLREKGGLGDGGGRGKSGGVGEVERRVGVWERWFVGVGVLNFLRM